MDLPDAYLRTSRRLAEYFVVCGLPEKPKPYDLTKVLTHSEEIIIPDKPVDFTAFPEPIVDIQFICLKERESLPHGYHAIRRSVSGRYKANIRGRIGDEVYLCYRRGRDRPPITNISMFTDNQTHQLRQDAWKITQTMEEKNANLGNALGYPTYLSYTRASPVSGIDQLAVVDMCIIFPDKEECCPPAFNKLSESLNSNPLGTKLHLCFRKSLIKEHTIAYEPEVLFCYRVPQLPWEFDCGPSTEQQDNSEDSPTEDPVKREQGSLDQDICQVANFCLPWGASIESWSVDQDHPQPNHFTFVLTNEVYQRLYGVAFTFHEPYDINKLDMDKCYRLGADPELLFPSSGSTAVVHTVDELDPEEKAKITARQKHFLRSRVGDRVIGVTKTICILSRWSFPVAFTNFLAFFYSRCFPGAKNDPVPLERYLTHFLCEVPFPDPKMPNILVELCAAPILLQLPDESNASSSSEPFFYLLSQLGVDLSIEMLVQMLTEQKVLLTSVQHFLLTQIGEALTSMIFPLQWAVVYIPFIYMGHVQVIQSPFPYLIGVDSRFFDFFRLPHGGEGITYVDLDTKNFQPAESLGQEAVLTAKMLPRKPMKELKAKLNALYAEICALRQRRSKEPANYMLKCLFSEPGSELANKELATLRKRTEIGARVKDAFMLFMASLLKDYRSYLIPVRLAERDMLFNNEAFLTHSADDKSRPFYSTLFQTQQWVNFVRDRSYASPREEELTNFDSLIARLWGERRAYSGNRTASACSVSSASSVRHSADNISVDISVIPGLNSTRDARDESVVLKLLSYGQMTNESTCTIGPPSWPVPLGDFSPEESTETVNHREKSLLPRCPFDLVPVNLNTRLMDRLVSYAYQQQFNALDEAVGLAPNDFSCGLFSLTASEPQPPTGTPAAANRMFYSRLLGVYPTIDNPSPLVPRASLNLGLTGLPTKFPLPISSSWILRRSPLEVGHTMEFCKRAVNEYGLPWAKQIVGTMYSLWFMLLPAYLGSLHMYASELQKAQPNEQGDQDGAMITLNNCLSEAVQLAARLTKYDMVGPDQVMERILLVLIYQNRPPDISIPDFLEEVEWNDSSLGLVNHIFKMYEKECQEMQRLERLRAHEHLCRQNTGTNRRSASVSYSTGDLGTVHSEPSFMELNPTEPGNVDDSSVGTQSTPLHCGVRESYMVHKRSSSSTAACFGFHTTDSVQTAKSETDSGLLLVAGSGEEPIADDPCMTGPRREAGQENSSESTVRAPIKRLSVTGASAPLASSDDLADLGYSTLQRPPDSISNFVPTTTTTQLPTSCEVQENVEASNSQTSPSRIPNQLSQASSNGFMEPLQKPPQSTWFESEPLQSSELRPDHPTSSRKHIVVAQNHRSSNSGESSDSSDGSDSREDENQPTGSRLPKYRSGDTQQTRPIDLRFDSSEQTTTMCYPFGQSDSISRNKSSTSAIGLTEHTNDAGQKPRGSLDYLNDMFTSLGTSDITSKMVESFRGWFSPGQKYSSTTENTPQSKRRIFPGNLNLFSTPNSARLPRNMRRWQVKNQGIADGSTLKNGEHGDDEEANDHMYPNEQPINMTAISQAALRGDALVALQFHRELWYRIGGTMVIGTPFQRLYPASLSTYFSGRMGWSSVAGNHNRLSQSPMLRTRGPIRPNRSPSSNPDICGTPSSQVLPGSSLNPGGRTSTEPNLTSLQSPEVVQLHIFLTTCNACPNCKTFVHDEEIMAAWSADEDERNIRCPFCEKEFAPQLTVRVLGDTGQQLSSPPTKQPTPVGDFSPTAGQSAGDTMRNDSSRNSLERTSPASVKGLMEFTHSYMSPFVLRKTLETVLQREGGECFRLVRTPKQTLLYRHEHLLWNLVWYTHRLGLPTNLLDTFPVWLMDRQAEQQLWLASGASMSPRRSETTNKTPDALLQVKLFPDLPVRISLRWNAYQSARSMASKPLYKQWLRRKSEYRSHCMLIQGSPSTSPVYTPSNLNLSASSKCPVEATMARVVDAIRQSKMANAFDSLVQFRASIAHQKPMSTVICNQSPSQPSGLILPTVPSPPLTQLTGSAVQKQVNNTRSECTETHRCAWCLEGSLYRELLFLTITALPPAHIDLVQFDEMYNHSYQHYRSKGNPLVHDSDRPPNYVASACRQMLRSLTLVP
ncbi:hypothetical protein CRM22_008990 [Opisthorchis felineus]|uniref:UDENN domain-containing protein n=1 Tax=Opisthorchis felineus TaxID=147828 RepID=A0A4S2LGV1_OPIFE|nr:hypothetical protein CRM22_008990 [Opisthorchis felineus]